MCDINSRNLKTIKIPQVACATHLKCHLMFTRSCKYNYKSQRRSVRFRFQSKSSGNDVEYINWFQPIPGWNGKYQMRIMCVQRRQIISHRFSLGCSIKFILINIELRSIMRLNIYTIFAWFISSMINSWMETVASAVVVVVAKIQIKNKILIAQIELRKFVNLLYYSTQFVAVSLRYRHGKTN